MLLLLRFILLRSMKSWTYFKAQSDLTPSSTTWYGSDGVALSAALTGDATAAAFAVSVDYPNPIFGLPDSLRNEWQPIANAIQARTGITPDGFALSAYDALFVVQHALNDVKQPNKKFDNFKAAFVQKADDYQDVNISTALVSIGGSLTGYFGF